jgi:SAF domain
MLAWAIGAMIAILVVGLVAFLARGRTDLLVPAKAIPAFHRIAAADLTTDSVWSQGGPGDAFKNPAELVGRVALSTLPAGSPISQEEVTPPITGRVGTVAIELPVEPSEALDLESGQRVIIHSEPNRSDLQPVTVGAVLLSPSEDGYLVAMRDPAATRLLDTLGRAHLFVTPIPHP